MGARPIDRRVKRTQDRLKNSLTRLMRVKSIRDISVKELTDLADMNRGTFYLHYKDIFDMVDKVETEMLEEFTSIINDRPNDDGVQPVQILKDIFDFFGKNSEICHTLLGANGDMAFLDRMKSLVREKCLKEWMALYSNINAKNFEHYYSFIVSGCLGVFMDWLEGGMIESSEHMASLTGQIILYGVKVLY